MEWDILRTLDAEQRREVLRRAVRRRYRAGDTLFHQGEAGDNMHLVDKGHVAIRVVSARGDTFTVDVLGPGASFGEQSLVHSEARRTASAVAIGTVETLMLQRAAFDELRRDYPATAWVLVELLAAQVRRLSEQLVDAHTMPADQRVLKQLRRLAGIFQDGATATLPITQEELASLAGTPRPTANRALQPLVNHGVVSLSRGRIIVHDVRQLPSI
jgi:CRP/FNR family transcriptional regulator, cyclic AMP receptor protein